MAYQKLKQEQYINVGGINTKMSTYVTNENAVLDLVNYDFQIVGQWTQRPGMTTALAGNTLAVGASNRFNFGWQTYRVRNEYLFGSSFSQQTYLQSNSGTYSLSLTNGVLTVPPGGTLTGSDGFGNFVNIATKSSSNVSSIYTVLNNGYFTSGFKNFKSHPINGIFYYGLPYDNDSIASNLSIGLTGTGTANGAANFKSAYVDYQGYVGPVSENPVQSNPVNRFAFYASGSTFTANALASGANSIRVYATSVLGFNSSDYVSVGDISAASPTLTINVTLGYLIPNSGYGEVAKSVVSNFTPTSGYPSSFTSLESSCVELFSNRLFWGVAKGQNILFYSDPIETQADAENIDVDSFLNLSSTNYPLVGIINYNQSLICLFQKGIGRLTGDNENNFNYQELNTEYGLVNSRAMVIFKERLWFMDEYQIIEFNGANFSNISTEVQGYLSRMNLTAAQKTATAIHYEDRNEVWFSLPIDGSNENNITIVFDYHVGAWYAIKSTSNFTNLTRFFDPTAQQGLSLSTVYMNNPRIFAGHPGGSLGYFSTAFKTDYGNAFTLTYKTRYHYSGGHSITNEWRRFYLDTGPWAGVTLSFAANFYANFATATVALTRTIYASGSPYSGPQQTRIDFGIPAKSLSIETHIATGASLPVIKVYGYTIESRFLRNV